MVPLTTDDDARTERRGALTMHLRHDVPLEAVLEALRAPGEILKVSSKTVTKRVGDWVVKQSRLQGGLGPLKHTLRRNRYRAGWRAAKRIERRGVRVPRPVAYVEKGCLGIIVGNAVVSEFLDGFRNVEQHAAELAANHASQETIGAFLDGLARAVNKLTAADAFHTDLSGKNVFTHHGTAFCFIDLDGVVLDRPYTEQCRLKNHVQLYDSFCDLFGDHLLEPFLARMLPGGQPISEWLAAVRAAQRVRRARTVAKWKKQGKLDSTPNEGGPS